MRFLLGLFLMALSIHAEIVGEVRMTVDAGDLPAAGRLVADYCKAHGTTPDVIFANSWIARGYLERGKLDDADKNAMETRAWALTLVMHRKLDAEPVLPLALSAAIEVHAQVLERRGQRSEAIAFLRGEEARWAASSMRARIQKNLNLLTLEGRPAPPINITEWTGDTKPGLQSGFRGDSGIEREVRPTRPQNHRAHDALRLHRGRRRCYARERKCLDCGDLQEILRADRGHARAY